MRVAALVRGLRRNSGGFHIVMNVSDIQGLGAGKELRLCLELMPLFIPCELWAVLSKCKWLPRLESKGELDHEAWEGNRKTFSLAPGLFMGGYQPYFSSCVCNGFSLSLENS